MTLPLDPWRRPRAAHEPPRVVLGTMNFGKRTDEVAAARIVDAALDRGITHLDTANAYVAGEGERLLGRLLRGRRDRLLLTSKVGLHRPGGVTAGLLTSGGEVEGLGPERIVAACDESLTRLGTDHLDLYLLHVPDRYTPLERSLEGVARLLEAGKIRAWGTSNFASWQLLELITLADRHGVPRPALSQQLYNVLVRQLDIEYFAFAARYGHHTSAYNPLAGGLLARPLPQEDPAAPLTPAPGSRFDGNAMYQARYLTRRMRDNVARYTELTQSLGCTLLELAYEFVAARPGVDSILVGPATVAHLDDALAALAKPLGEDALARIDALHLELAGTDARYARL
ncbi:MAG: aldo/keto reductase [Deltaproteobacteria bacterium]|nr:aldo/keto reductase [Deltaproteobacteria bacterium]